VFENRVLRRMSGLKMDETLRERRKLHTEALCHLLSLPSIIRLKKFGGCDGWDI
jgi:hypothetical protein